MQCLSPKGGVKTVDFVVRFATTLPKECAGAEPTLSTNGPRVERPSMFTGRRSERGTT
jgi:hypothetical protein